MICRMYRNAEHVQLTAMMNQDEKRFTTLEHIHYGCQDGRRNTAQLAGVLERNTLIKLIIYISLREKDVK